MVSELDKAKMPNVYRLNPKTGRYVKRKTTEAKSFKKDNFKTSELKDTDIENFDLPDLETNVPSNVPATTVAQAPTKKRTNNTLSELHRIAKEARSNGQTFKNNAEAMKYASGVYKSSKN